MNLSLFVCTRLSSKATNSQAQSNAAETEFNVKWPFSVIQGHVFWDQWKADDGLHVTI